MVVPNTLSCNTILRSLCGCCINLLHGSKNKDGKGETIQALFEDDNVRNGPSAHDAEAEKQREIGCERVYASQQSNMIIDEDGIMRTATNGDLAVVVTQVLKQRKF